jgi:hypothetical protein
VAILCGRAGRLTAENGGFRPGQERKKACTAGEVCDKVQVPGQDPIGSNNYSDYQLDFYACLSEPGFGRPGAKGVLTPPPPLQEHLLTSFQTVLMVQFGGHRLFHRFDPPDPFALPTPRSELDSAVGEIIAALDRTGYRDNTMVWLSTGRKR